MSETEKSVKLLMSVKHDKNSNKSIVRNQPNGEHKQLIIPRENNDAQERRCK